MAYSSLFDQYEALIGNFLATSIHYQGSLEDVLNKTERILRINQGSRDGYNVLDLILNPPRIMRAIINHKIAFPERRVEGLLRNAVNLGLKIYSGEDSLEDLRDLRHELAGIGNDGPLTKTLIQSQDHQTWSASHPSKSEGTSKSLFLSKSGDILLIALGHGGIAAGMDVFLRYKNRREGDKSVFYPVRFSRNKHNDDVPRVTEREISYLRNKSRNRRVVIFDEDTYTGDTLFEAGSYFSRVLSPKRSIVKRANKVDSD